MKHVLLAILIVLTATATKVEAAATPTPLTPDCRYLFVVDTSLSMNRLQDQVTDSLQRMIATGLDGQMSPGEVFTIWTFNEAVYQRDYPLNSWRPELNQSMGNRVRQYMQAQRYRRDANMRALINAVSQAQQTCPRLVIFLISNGKEVLVGTPYDRNINVSYGRRFEELRSARVPFLTTLACRDGKFVAWSVGAANEPINLPVGADGKPIVGRPRQIAAMGPTPALTTKTAAGPNLVVSPTGVNAAGPVVSVSTNQPMRANASRPGVIMLPGPPPTERKVVSLTAKPTDPDAPRVVKPTDIAPTRKTTRPVFRKTNAVTQSSAGVALPKTNPVAPVAVTNVSIRRVTPATNKPPVRVAKVEPSPGSPPPTVPKATATLTVKSANRPGPKPVSPAPQSPRTNAVPAPSILPTTAPLPAVPEPKPKPEPEVVIQVVTQIVMVPLPAIASERVSQPPNSVSPEKPTAKIAPAEPEKLVTGPRPAPQTNPVVAAPSVSSPAPPPSTALPVAPTEPAPANGVAALVGPNGQDLTAWIFLGGGILALLIAIACARRLLARPDETSMISQSMERRDNG